MPKLDAEQVRILLDVLCKTQDEELTCDECLPHLASLVDNELAGKDQSEAMQIVARHLEICPECVEELEAIRNAIAAMGSDES